MDKLNPSLPQPVETFTFAYSAAQYGEAALAFSLHVRGKQSRSFNPSPVAIPRPLWTGIVWNPPRTFLTNRTSTIHTPLEASLAFYLVSPHFLFNQLLNNVHHILGSRQEPSR